MDATRRLTRSVSAATAISVPGAPLLVLTTPTLPSGLDNFQRELKGKSGNEIRVIRRQRAAPSSAVLNRILTRRRQRTPAEQAAIDSHSRPHKAFATAAAKRRFREEAWRIRNEKTQRTHHLTATTLDTVAVSQLQLQAQLQEALSVQVTQLQASIATLQLIRAKANEIDNIIAALQRDLQNKQ